MHEKGLGKPGPFIFCMIRLDLRNTVRSDDEWRTGLSPRDRRTVELLTWPLRHRYGY